MKIKTALLTTFIAFAVCSSAFSVSAADSAKLSDEEAAFVLAAVEEENNGDVEMYIGVLPYEEIKKLDVEDQAKFDLAEMERMEKESKKNSDSDYLGMFCDTTKDDIDLSNCFKITGYDINDAYKMHYIATSNGMINDYKTTHDFKSLIGENEVVMLPAEGELVTLNKKDSGYNVSGSKYTDEIPEFNTITQNAVNSLGEEVLNVMHVYNTDYYMDIIYIETVQNEYAIPFFKSGTCLDPGDRLTSGTLYTLGEFMDRMDQTYEEDYQPYDENGEYLYGSGVSVKDYKPNVPSALAANGSQTNAEIPNAEIGGVASINPNSIKDKASNVFSYVLLAAAAVFSLSFLGAMVVLNRKKHA